MKLLTLNTHSWLEDQQEEKMHRIAKKIHDEGFDVIALQEVNQTVEAPIVPLPFNFCSGDDDNMVIKEDNFALALVTYLEQTYHDTYYWSWAYNHIGYDKYDEGVAILTKYRPETIKVYNISKADDPKDYHTRYALEMTTKELPYTFVSLHASWWRSPEGDITFPYEAKQLQKLADLHNHPVFLMGDFNNPSQKRQEGYDLMMKTWYDTYELATQKIGKYTMGGAIAGWEGQDEQLRIDFIMINKKLAIQKAQVCFNGQDEPPVSDHFGYMIEL